MIGPFLKRNVAPSGWPNLSYGASAVTAKTDPDGRRAHSDPAHRRIDVHRRSSFLQVLAAAGGLRQTFETMLADKDVVRSEFAEAFEDPSIATDSDIDTYLRPLARTAVERIRQANRDRLGRRRCLLRPGGDNPGYSPARRAQRRTSVRSVGPPHGIQSGSSGILEQCRLGACPSNRIAENFGVRNSAKHEDAA